jgi:hypothetical protein
MLCSVNTPAGQVAVFAAAGMVLCAFLLWSGRTTSTSFFRGALVSAPLGIFALHQHMLASRSDLVLAFALYPVTDPLAMLTVLAIAVGVLVGFLAWSKQSKSHSFFLGVLAGIGLVLSFDIVWVHWISELHHITNTRMDLILEPLFVLVGIVFMWFGITRERSGAV